MQFSLFFFGPLHFYIDKYIHVQLNFDVFTIDILNIIDVLKWVKTTVRYTYIYNFYYPWISQRFMLVLVDFH